MVFTRAMSRRTWRTRPMPSVWPVARWKRRLNCSRLRSSSIVSSSSLVLMRTSAALVVFAISRVSHAGDEARLDGELRGAERKSLARGRFGDAVELEHDAAGGDAADPEFGAA